MKNLLLLSTILLLSLASFSQSETHDFKTYDTTIGGYYLRVERPVNYFTKGHPDTASRQVLFSHAGDGEQGANAVGRIATQLIPYWRLNGWDGGIQLGNGKHYPILIHASSKSNYPNEKMLSELLAILITEFHPKQIEGIGLSRGAFNLTALINYEAVKGAETGMKQVKSIVALQGCTLPNYPAEAPWGAWMRGWPAWGYWAKKYDGRYFGLEGYMDNRGNARAQKAMDDSLKGHAYFSYETLGGGIHCCWNDMTNPANKNWQTFNPKGPYIINGTDSLSRGNYITGDNIFTWMFKQGDTSMVGGAPPVVITTPKAVLTVDSTTINAYNSIIHADISKSTNYLTSALDQVSGPCTCTIFTEDTLGRIVISGLRPGAYKFRLVVTDKSGKQDSAFVNITVNPVPPTPCPICPPQRSVKSVNVQWTASGPIVTGQYDDGTNF